MALLLLLFLLPRRFGLAFASPLTVTVRPSLHFTPHSRPHLIQQLLFFGRRLLRSLHSEKERGTIIRHRWSSAARSLAAAAALTSLLTHSLTTLSPLLLHRLHSLTASLRRLTNRSLRLRSSSPPFLSLSLSLSLSRPSLLSHHCVFFMHLINLLPPPTAERLLPKRTARPAAACAREGGIPEVRVPPAQFGWSPRPTPLHSIPLTAALRCTDGNGIPQPQPHGWMGWLDGWSRADGLASGYAARRSVKLLLALAHSISKALRIRCHC